MFLTLLLDYSIDVYMHLLPDLWCYKDNSNKSFKNYRSLWDVAGHSYVRQPSLCDEQALRYAKATHRGARWDVGSADVTECSYIGQSVHILQSHHPIHAHLKDKIDQKW